MWKIQCQTPNSGNLFRHPHHLSMRLAHKNFHKKVGPGCTLRTEPATKVRREYVLWGIAYHEYMLHLCQDNVTLWVHVLHHFGGAPWVQYGCWTCCNLISTPVLRRFYFWTSYFSGIIHPPLEYVPKNYCTISSLSFQSKQIADMWTNLAMMG